MCQCSVFLLGITDINEVHLIVYKECTRVQMFSSVRGLFMILAWTEKKWEANQEIYSISLFGKWLECIGK